MPLDLLKTWLGDAGGATGRARAKAHAAGLFVVPVRSPYRNFPVKLALQGNHS